MGHVASTFSKLLEAAKKIRIYMLWVLKVTNGSKRNLKHLALASSFLGVSFPCKLITSLVSIVGTYCYSQVNGNGDKMTGAKKWEALSSYMEDSTSIWKTVCQVHLGSVICHEQIKKLWCICICICVYVCVCVLISHNWKSFHLKHG